MTREWQTDRGWLTSEGTEALVADLTEQAVAARNRTVIAVLAGDFVKAGTEAAAAGVFQDLAAAIADGIYNAKEEMRRNGND